MIAQGQFIFKPIVSPTGDVFFKLSFSGPYKINGDTSMFKNDASGYRAALITTYRAGRTTKTPFGDIPATRTAIYPKFYRKSAVDINSII
jgi:hypothetical protein